ncbi:MAG: aldolase/citrate lyase family protein [Acutalibacteraceae bacterium]|nr:aldolase/citrate lyase family protein [Acutalibacteraceae bacterium]
MALKLMYITNNPEVASLLDTQGVDRIFLDLEIIGKDQRQGHLDTVISRHSIDDVAKLRKVIKNGKLLVRCNPIHNDTKQEIDRIISDGADIIMLPYFKTVEEVNTFIDCVNGRATTCLLFETPEAVELADEILSIKGIDEVHIGLNDLHLGYGLSFMFQLLTNGVVEGLCQTLKKIWYTIWYWRNCSIKLRYITC